MIKKLFKVSLFFIIIITIIISYLSFFGFKTEKFNKLIKDKIVSIDNKINLELKSVKFLLNPLNFSISVKTLDPEILIKNNRLKLEYIETRISLKSFVNKKFSIDDLQISTKDNKLRDIIASAKSFQNSKELFILDKIIRNGYLVGNINLNFDKDGKIKDNYEIDGLIKNAELKLLNKNSISNLNLIFKIKDRDYFLKDIKAEYNKIKLSSSEIKITQKQKLFSVVGELINKEDNIDIKMLQNLFGKNFDIENTSFGSKSKFTFDINRRLKVKNFKLNSEINLNKLEYKKDLSNLKKYLPNIKKNIKFKDHKIFIKYDNNKININGKGQIKIEDKSDIFNYKVIKEKNHYVFDLNVNIKKNPLFINVLEYKKKENLDSQLQLKGMYAGNKEIRLDLISFKENKNVFLIKNLRLDKDYKITDLDLLELNYVNKNKKKNQISLKKIKKNYILSGKKLDASKFINQVIESGNQNSFSLFKDIKSSIKVKIVKAYLDEDTFINDLEGSIYFKNNQINQLTLDSSFPNNKKLTLTINTNENNEKITTLFSDYPKPLVKQYKFIKGFEEGVLDFYSIKKNNVTNSVLKIDNFKVQEVPVLAKLLTLASLQGIADLLTGEGIRFTDFEMKYSSKGNLTKIEEMYSIGPAISILMEGYIERKKLISLRGTLVPATTINRTISSIPLIGDLLVGKKVGEGVFGVSFKIKGPPKNLKTTVNPIKTLTPRFITRTIEKIKKN
jgi:hypothetical protein